MAVGDLVTADYQFEFNNLAIGAGTNYDLISIENLLGFESRTSSVDRFGRHGGTSGRHYAAIKNITISGTFVAGNDTEYEARRAALANAYNIRVDYADRIPLVWQLPGAGATKVQLLCKPLALRIPITRDFALGYVPFLIRLEAADPRAYSLVEKTTIFNPAGGSQTLVLNNAGSAPTTWTGTLVGPATDPEIRHMGTLQDVNLQRTITGLETVTYDSNDSTVKIAGSSIGTAFASGVSWFDLDPGDNSIRFQATDAGAASFQIVYRDAYWMN